MVAVCVPFHRSGQILANDEAERFKNRNKLKLNKEAMNAPLFQTRFLRSLIVRLGEFLKVVELV